MTKTIILSIILTLFVISSIPVLAIDPKDGEEPIMHSDVVNVSTKTQKMAERFEKDIRNGRLKRRTNTAIDAIIKLAAYKLYREDLDSVADKLLKEWNDQYRFYLDETRCVGITCHEPLNKWLAEKSLMLEFILGKDVCHALRLDDLVTINYSLKLIFACPDGVTEQDFFLHMVKDDVNGYRGLIPVVSYWVTEIACVGFSFGTGFLWCAPVALGVELITLYTAAPKLSSWIYPSACLKEMASWR